MLQDDLVNFKVNKISSTKTALPFEYYSLPFCRPDPIINSAENLGEVLRGDRILNSLYQVRVQSKVCCVIVLEESAAASRETLCLTVMLCFCC
jgi:transmembrane 9 superfamily protein 2/4